MKCFTIVLLFTVCVSISIAAKLQEKFRWKEVQYAWPSDAAKEEATTSGRYKAENNLPLGLDVWKDKLFITVPRYFIYDQNTWLHSVYANDTIESWMKVKQNIDVVEMESKKKKRILSQKYAFVS